MTATVIWKKAVMDDGADDDNDDAPLQQKQWR